MIQRLGIIAVAALLILNGCDARMDQAWEEEQRQGPAQGDFVPEYTAKTLAGDSVSLSDFRGQAVLVNFWATWCKPCVAEFPDLIALHEELGPGLTVLGVSIDTRPPEEVQAFLDRHGVPWLNAIDSDMNVDAIFGWKSGVPKNLLIGPDGRVVVWWWGQLDTSSPRNRSYLEEALEQVVVGT